MHLNNIFNAFVQVISINKIDKYFQIPFAVFSYENREMGHDKQAILRF